MPSLLLLLTAALLGPGADAGATSVVRFSFDTLCGQARQIAVVECLETGAVASDGRAGVRTRTRFRVLEGIKGRTGEEITVSLPGGRLGDRRVRVPGVPRFTPGEQLVIFLSEEDDTGSPWPVGLQQGCYPVVRDESGARKVTLRSGTTPIPEGAAFKPASGEPYRVDLASFLQKVRDVVGAQAGAADSPDPK